MAADSGHSPQAGQGYRFNWSTQHKLEIVQPATSFMGRQAAKSRN
jgi:hypothetical protein